MVEAILRMFKKETNGLHEAAFLLGCFALLSQLLALVRDKLLAATFGAGHTLDLYYAAFRVPDFLFVTIGSLVSLSVLIPFLVQKYQEGQNQTRVFIDSIFTLFFLGIVGISFVVYLLSPWLTHTLFPGFSAAAQDTVSLLTRVLLLSPIILGVSNLFGSLAQSKNRFFVYAVSPLLYNVGIIFGVVFMFPHFGISGLVWGVVLGACLHLIIQVPTVSYIKLLPRITLKPDFSSVRKVTLLSFPRTITLSVSHIAIFFLLSLASFMAQGSISIFNLAFNLQSVPLSIFGVSYSMAAFPALSRMYTKGDTKGFLDQFVTSAQHIIFWTVPSTVLFIVLRAHIVRIVLGAGQFDWTDTRLTAAVLALFAVSLVFQALILLFVRALYAMGATGKPFSITIFSGIAIVSFSFLLSRLFLISSTFQFFIESLLKIPDVGGSQVTMLALGFTLGTILECFLLWVLFAKSWKDFSSRLISSLFRIFSASVIMGFVTFVSLRFFNILFSLDTFWGVFLQTILSAFVGVCAGILILVLLKSPELEAIKVTIHKKFWKAQTLSPDSELV